MHPHRRSLLVWCLHRRKQRQRLRLRRMPTCFLEHPHHHRHDRFQIRTRERRWSVVIEATSRRSATKVTRECSLRKAFRYSVPPAAASSPVISVKRLLSTLSTTSTAVISPPSESALFDSYSFRSADMIAIRLVCYLRPRVGLSALQKFDQTVFGFCPVQLDVFFTSQGL